MKKKKQTGAKFGIYKEPKLTKQKPYWIFREYMDLKIPATPKEYIEHLEMKIRDYIVMNKIADARLSAIKDMKNELLEMVKISLRK